MPPKEPASRSSTNTGASGWEPQPPTPPTPPHQPRPPRPDTAIILAGAVAQGAFAAGALDVIARRHRQLPVSRVVATSAGALSGALYAAGIRGGRIEDAASTLVELWSREAHWCNAVDLSARDLVRARGLSTNKKLLGVLRRAIEPFVPGSREPIDLRLIVTALAGDPKIRREEGATSYESVVRIASDDFDERESRERLFAAVTAAAAFPALYAPVQLAGVGQCLDGGMTNNAPIKHALEGCELRRVIIISNTPTLVAAPPLHGAHLAEHAADVLIHERLYRDLRAARSVNRQLAALDELVTRGVITANDLAAVKSALRWRDRRRLEIIEIRPAAALRGGAFAALSDRTLRDEYIAEGRHAAELALASLTAPHVDDAHHVDRTNHETAL